MAPRYLVHEGSVPEIQQCLFGYDAGHTLLATSTALSSEVRRLLLIQTDYPGTGGDDSSVDGLVAGYPLPTTDFYALTRTWLAPEMPRPGCVFTHVLLVDRAFLDRERDLSRLRDLFRRPRSVQDYPNYGRPNSRIGTADSIADVSRVELARIAAATFLTDDPINIRLEPWRDSSNVALRIWSVLGPAARAQFTFATGGSSPRAIARRPFDLQLVPARRAMEFRGRIVIESQYGQSRLGADSAGRWITDVLDFMTTGKPTPTTEQLWAFGRDKTSRSSAMAASLTNSVDLRLPAPALAVAASVFPQASDARELKRAVLARAVGVELEGNPSLNFDALSLFISNPNAAYAFDFDDEALTGAIESLASRAPSDAAKLLELGMLRSPELTNTTMLRLATSDRLAVVLTAVSSLAALSVLASRLPDSALLSLLTSSDHVVLQAALEVISKRPTLMPAAAEALLDQRNTLALKEFIKLAPRQACDALLDAANTESARASALPAYAPWDDAAPHWLMRNSAISESVAAFLSMHLATTDQLVDIGPEPWLGLANAMASESHRAKPDSAAFLFLLGLMASSAVWAQLVASGFVVLHEREIRSDLPKRTWRRLEPFLAPPRFWGDWDRARRLRGPFIKFFVSTGADPALFAKAASRTDVTRVWAETQEVSGGWDFLNRVRAASGGRQAGEY
jgi:hypothetical protein